MCEGCLCEGCLCALSQVYVTILKHGDSTTLDTMLKVSARSFLHTTSLCSEELKVPPCALTV